MEFKLIMPSVFQLSAWLTLTYLKCCYLDIVGIHLYSHVMFFNAQFTIYLALFKLCLSFHLSLKLRILHEIGKRFTCSMWHHWMDFWSCPWSIFPTIEWWTYKLSQVCALWFNKMKGKFWLDSVKFSSVFFFLSFCISFVIIV